MVPLIRLCNLVKVFCTEKFNSCRDSLSFVWHILLYGHVYLSFSSGLFMLVHQCRGHTRFLIYHLHMLPLGVGAEKMQNLNYMM
ncbi:hypothetical protein L1887_16943 [Cichorium endivia]|nr:hypothetical protein L1887_16943 [Cichorium endivia]